MNKGSGEFISKPHWLGMQERRARGAMISLNPCTWSSPVNTVPHSKVCTLSELASRIANSSALGLGGVFLHRGPFALVRELVRQQRRDLEIIKPSPGYDLDLLCRAGLARKVRAGIVAMEGNFGLAPWYRRAIERQEAVLEEHA